VQEPKILLTNTNCAVNRLRSVFRMKCNLLYENNYTQDSMDMVISKYLVRDLKLDLVFESMADGDESLKKICENVLLAPVTDIHAIKARQEVLQDALMNNNFFNRIYHLTSEVLDRVNAFDEIIKPKYDHDIPISKKIITHNDIAQIYISYLKKMYEELQNVTGLKAERCINFISEFKSIYSKEFMNAASQQLEKMEVLKTNAMVVLGGHFGVGMKLTDVQMHEIQKKDGLKNSSRISIGIQRVKKYQILLENIPLCNNEREMLDAGLSGVLKIIVEFNRKMRLVFEECQKQFGFFVGAVNLFNSLKASGLTICYPSIHQDSKETQFEDLVDVGIVLKGEKAIPNTVEAKSKKIWIITGANQGGKTTFLRSIGLAQLMAQAGLFVTAKNYNCNVYQGIFTHFPDEEDKVLKSGLLDQELKKVNTIINKIKPNSMILMNESFSTTTEFDACYLADEIIMGFHECNITTLFVTHNYKYANSIYQLQQEDAIFLRAGRNEDGERDYHIMVGEPLKSSFAQDLYDQIIEI
jgi:hypothetical protein